MLAYDGKDVRREAWKFVKRARAANLGAPKVARAVDLGCGTGFTARSLARTFFSRNREEESLDSIAVGLDTSPEMISMARTLSCLDENTLIDTVKFVQANAEDTGLPRSTFDLVVAAFVLHECPREARHQILEEGLRLLAPGGTLAVLDIHTDYQPSQFMEPGEPYLNGYLDFFEEDAAHFAIRHARHIASAHRDVIVPGRLALWHFHANPQTPEPVFDIKRTF